MFGAVLALAALTEACMPVLLPPGKVEISDGYRANIQPAPAPSLPATVVLPPSKRFLPRSGEQDLRFAAGVHLGSILPPERTHLDVGIGYVFTDVGLGDRTLHGMYGEVGPVLWRGEWARLLLSARGEALFADRGHSGTGYAIFGRLGVEAFRYTPGEGSTDSNGAGAISGVGGMGLFTEVGNQKLPGGEHAVVLSGGLWFRLPAAAALVCCILPK
jgi:hypothetical protein